MTRPTMALTKQRKGSLGIVSRVALGLPVATAALAALCAQPVSASLTTYGLDSTANGTNPLAPPPPTAPVSGIQAVSQNSRLFRAFKMGPADAFLTEMRLGVSVPAALGEKRTIEAEVFQATQDTSQPNFWKPTGTSLGKFNIEITSTGSNVPFYTALTPVGPTLSSVIFTANMNYGISFRSLQNNSVGLRRCSGAATPPTGCDAWPIQAYGGVAYLGGARSTTAIPNWFDATDLQESTYMQLNFTPVPAPAFMGFSSVSGLMVYSRRLRSRIKRSVA